MPSLLQNKKGTSVANKSIEKKKDIAEVSAMSFFFCLELTTQMGEQIGIKV